MAAVSNFFPDKTLLDRTSAPFYLSEELLCSYNVPSFGSRLRGATLLWIEFVFNLQDPPALLGGLHLTYNTMAHKAY